MFLKVLLFVLFPGMYILFMMFGAFGSNASRKYNKESLKVADTVILNRLSDTYDFFYKKDTRSRYEKLKAKHKSA